MCDTLALAMINDTRLAAQKLIELAARRLRDTVTLTKMTLQEFKFGPYSTGSALCLSAFPSTCVLGGAALSVSRSIAGSARPMGLRRICAARYELRVIQHGPTQPTTECN